MKAIIGKDEDGNPKFELKQEYFGLLVLSLFSPLAWVRKIETFKFGFIFGFAMIIITLITISVFCVGINTTRIADENYMAEQAEINGKEF